MYKKITLPPETEPIIIKYDYIVETTDTHYLVSVAKRIIGLNKYNIKHNEKEKTMTIIPGGY